MFKVMITDNISPVAKDILEKTGKIEVVVENGKTTGDPEKLSKIIGNFHGLAVRSKTKVTKEVLKEAKLLKVIGRAGIGVDNVDVRSATKQGIVVMNAPGGNTITTAEHAISLMMSLSRNIPQGTESLREGKWEKKKLSGVEITGKILGILGLGQIGRIVADRAKGLKMNVIAHDPFISGTVAEELNVDLMSLDDLFKKSDFITLHVPRMKDTVGMINSDAIAKMKRGVRIINCSRGEIINIDDLYDAVNSGYVAGVALDVFPTEPPDPNLPILGHPNVIFTPHLGASTSEAQEKVSEMIAGQMAAFLINDTIKHAVNFPSVSRKTMNIIRPHLDLIEKMGALMGQLVKKAYDITLTYCGDIADLDTRPMTHAAVKGFLDCFTDRPLNYVNALAIAREKGIQVKETTTMAKDDFSGLIKLKLEGYTDGPGEIWGAIFSDIYPRIVRFGRIYMDAIPEGSMIIVRNIDAPGVIGDLGKLLGNHNINIGRFQLGRLDDRALCMINIDTPADDSIIEEICSLPNILSACQVQL